jgi:hypothetical protein
MRNLFVPVCIATCMMLPAGLLANVQQVKLKSAMASKMVSVTAIGNGGAMGKKLHLDLVNNLSVPLEVVVDPGLIFRPVDSSYQNLVAVGEEKVTIEPGAGASLDLQTFCGKSYARSPFMNLNYNFWKQGDSVMIKALGFIREHKLYSTVGQCAVWSLTNNHSLAGIYDQTEISKKFAGYMSVLTGRKLPPYYVTNKITDVPGTVAYNPAVDKYYVDFEWKPLSARNMHVYVLKEDGTLLWEHKKDIISHEGHKAIVELDPGKLARGKYVVELSDDDNFVWQSYEVMVE